MKNDAEVEQLEEPTEVAGSIEFCIRMSPDGALTYYTERDGQSAEEQSVSDIGQALKMALDAYKTAEAQAGGGQNQSFDAGFGSSRASGAGDRAQRMGMLK